MPKTEKILFCNCGNSDIIDSSLKTQVLDALAETKVDFEAVQDLCELAAKKDPKLKRWKQADSLTIAACYPRTIKWLFNAADARLDLDKTRFLNMRTDTAEKILSSLLDKKTPVTDKKEIQLEEKGDWIPWFPVIDYDRCKNCMQCLNFCLFGVYELSSKEEVQVANPAGCKTNCPACARLCPHKAIIFPKYPDSPINGDEVDSNQCESEEAKADIYEMLKQRNKSRKRFEKGKTGLRNIDLTKLKDQFGVPPEVLSSLKSSKLAELKKISEKKDCE